MIEIDGVIRALEKPITEAGDQLSDEYFIAIDLTTAPVRTVFDTERLARAIRRLNRNICTTYVYLADESTIGDYNSVCTQINEINASYPGYVGDLHPIDNEATDDASYSDSFNWG